MAQREMEQVRVYTSDDGRIIISQQVFGDDDAVISVNPGQVDLLVKWLLEAKKELE